MKHILSRVAQGNIILYASPGKEGFWIFNINYFTVFHGGVILTFYAFKMPDNCRETIIRRIHRRITHTRLSIIAHETEMNCNICDGNIVAEKYRFAYGSILHCDECGCEFLMPQPTDGRLSEIYSGDYYEPWGLSENVYNLTRNMKYNTGLKHIEWISQFKPDGKLLDVGCAFGFFLEAARDKGFDAFGIEFSEFSALRAKEVFGKEKIFNGTIENSPFEKGTFSVVTLFDLLEHTRTPSETLKAAGEMLLDSGIMALTTPNIFSLTRHLMGKRWLHYKEEHLYYFSRKSIEELTARMNFEILTAVRCKKVFFLSYVFTQFENYKHWLLTPFFRLVKRITPQVLQRLSFSLSIGELFVILKKKSECDECNEDPL